MREGFVRGRQFAGCRELLSGRCSWSEHYGFCPQRTGFVEFILRTIPVLCAGEEELVGPSAAGLIRRYQSIRRIEHHVLPERSLAVSRSAPVLQNQHGQSNEARVTAR